MPTPLDDHAFDAIADRTLKALELALNEVDDLEVDLESGILTVEFADGIKFVVNSHRAARQIWMAAASRAWHFDVEPSRGLWTAAKSGDELWACLEGQLAAKLGRAVRLPRG